MCDECGECSGAFLLPLGQSDRWRSRAPTLVALTGSHPSGAHGLPLRHNLLSHAGRDVVEGPPNHTQSYGQH